MQIHGNNLTELGKGRQDIFFININKFRVSFLKDDYPISVDFKINSFKWKLNRIYLPVDIIASKINN